MYTLSLMDAAEYPDLKAKVLIRAWDKLCHHTNNGFLTSGRFFEVCVGLFSIYSLAILCKPSSSKGFKSDVIKMPSPLPS